MAEPTEVKRLRDRIRGFWPDNHMLRDDLEALIAAVREEALAEPSIEEWQQIQLKAGLPNAPIRTIAAYRRLRGAKP